MASPEDHPPAGYVFMQGMGGSKFVHNCWCGKWGAFGVNVQLRKATREKNASLAGKWYCAEHQPGAVKHDDPF